MNKDALEDTLESKTEKVTGHREEAAGEPTGDYALKTESAKDQAKSQLHEIVEAVKQLGKDISAGVKDGQEAAKRNA